MRNSSLISGRALVGSALTHTRVSVISPSLVVKQAQKQNSSTKCGRSHSTVPASLPAAATLTAMGDKKAYVPQVEVSKYGDQLAAKTDRLKTILSEFSPLPEIEVFEGPAEHYRCRTEFAVWHEDTESNYVMYEAQPGKKGPQRVPVQQYPVASKLINSMMPIVMQKICENEVLRRKLFQVNYHTTLSGHALVTMIYHKKLLDFQTEWEKVALQLREKLRTDVEGANEVHILGRSKKARILLDRDYVVENQTIAGKTFTQKQPEGTFSQPNGAMCEKMVSWAEKQTRGSSGDLLELYCGNGNFTIPLAANFRRVVATELSKVSVAAARDNVEANGVNNIFLARMSSEEFVEAWNTKAKKNRLKGLVWDELELNTLLVDPPRAGLDKDTAELMKRFVNVVYISCNPETLAENLRVVKDTHVIKSVALFDQFPFTHHIECGVYLERIPNVQPEANGT